MLKRDSFKPAADSPNHPDNAELWEPKGEDLDILSMFSTNAPPGREILPGMEEGTVGGLLATGGSSKSMHSLQLAVQLCMTPAHQSLWPYSVIDPRKQQLNVIYASIEDPKRQVHTRLRAMGSMIDLTEQHRVAHSLRVRDLRLEPPDIMQPKWQDQFLNYMTGRDLLILDTFRRSHRQEESSNDDMAEVLLAFETLAANTNCAVLYIHHVSKAAVMNGTADIAQAGRGASVLTDNVRWVANMVPMSKEEANTMGETHGQLVGEDLRKSYVRWMTTKTNYGGGGEQWYQRDARTGLLQRVNLVVAGRPKTVVSKNKLPLANKTKEVKNGSSF